MNDSPPDSESITPRASSPCARARGARGLAAPRWRPIKEARELGDLKETPTTIAKDDQGHLEARIRRLRERLRKATVVEHRGRARLVRIRPHRRGPRRFDRQGEQMDLVGPTRADFSSGKLSIESPVGARSGHPIGEAVAVDTPRREDLPRAKLVSERGADRRSGRASSPSGSRLGRFVRSETAIP
jgi:transcription elongation GreA/GreB family factor